MGASFLLSLHNFSPLWRWDHVSNDPSAGWTVTCGQQVLGLYRCDENTAQRTTLSSNASLTFWGTDITVYGNSTGGMSWKMTIDGSSVQTSSTSTTGFSNTLASWHGLSMSQEHVLTLEVVPTPGATSIFNLDRADVTMDMGISGTVNSNYVDDLDSAIQYSNFTFYQYPEYDGTILPSTIHNTTFHGSQNFGDNYSLIFNASTIVVYGPCYAACGGYLVSIDQELPVSFNGSYLAPTQVGENCVRYVRAGLDPSKQHSITVTTNDAKRFNTIDWVQLVTVSPDSDGGGGSLAKAKSSNAGAIAGGVVGGIVALLLALALFLFLRRRKRAPTRPTAFDAGAVGHDHDGSSGELEDKIESGPGAGAVTAEVLRSSQLGRRNGSGVLGSGPPSGTAATASEGTPATPSFGIYRQPYSTTSSFPSFPPSSPSRLSHEPAPMAVVTPEGHREGAVPPPSSTTSNTNTSSSDSRPPEKRDPPDSARSVSTRRIPPSITTASHTSAGVALPSLREVDHSPSINSSTPSVGVAATLSQVSRDVNRILTQLGSLRITPGEAVDENHPVMDEILSTPHLNSAGMRSGSLEVHDDGAEPPDYDEDESTRRHT